MNNETKMKLSRYSILLCIILCLAISIIFGFFNKPKVEQYKPFIIYTKASQDIISDSVDRNLIKKLNIVNSEYVKKYTDNEKVNILPQEGISSYYRIKIVSRNGLNQAELDNIYEDYVNFIKEQRIEGIVHISPLNYDNITYSNSKVNGVYIGLIQGLTFIFAFSLLYYFLRTWLAEFKLSIFSIFSVCLFLFATIFGGTVILVSAYLAFSAILVVVGDNKDNEGSIIRITILALMVRCFVTVLMLFYNFYKYRTFYSYSQTDEIFYYSSGDYIYKYLVNFKFPNLRAITGLDQYGYNLFIGIVKFINNGDIFITAKIINILISIVFVALFFNFVYKITCNKDIAIIGSVLMAVMPTFAVFSSFALRDIFISVFIFIIMSEIICFKNSNRKLLSILSMIIAFVCLWYLRKFALLIVITLALLYLVVKFFVDRSINVLIIIITLIVLVFCLAFVASKLYSFNILHMIINYIDQKGMINFITGIILSLVNLDFLANAKATLYSSPKALLLRSLYPETLFLIVTFPIMCLGLLKAKAKNISLVIVVILMFIGFVSIYKIQYGGWFLRTQLQVFPYQYLFISWGLYELFHSKFKLSR